MNELDHVVIGMIITIIIVVSFLFYNNSFTTPWLLSLGVFGIFFIIALILKVKDSKEKIE